MTNCLRVLNRELGADFDIDAFSYVPFWDPRQERMDLRLRADMPQRVTIPGADLTFDLAHGEEIRVEISTKFRRESLRDEPGRRRLHGRAHVDRRRRRLRPDPGPPRRLNEWVRSRSAAGSRRGPSRRLAHWALQYDTT